MIDSLQPDTVDWSMVNTGVDTDHESLISNAGYAVTMARMIGAPVYALPEDIVEGRQRMIMTVFASLMLTVNNHQKHDLKGRNQESEIL